VSVVPLAWYLLLAAALFAVGLYAVLGRRGLPGTLVGVVLLLNAVVLNLVAFWRYVEVTTARGRAFALFVYAIAAVEVAIGSALALVVWRRQGTTALDELDVGDR
jgi:NADH-quinone oxidoreductase subunit K